jgi:glutamate decarboxylase
MNRCDSLLTDVKLALQTLESMDQAMITKYKA